MAKGTIYPKDFYVIADDKDSIRFYDQDPLGLENAEDKDIDFGQKLFQEYGVGDVRNPLVIRVLGTIIHRSEKFDAVKYSKNLKLRAPIHVEDAEGNIVHVSFGKNNDFPVIGDLISLDGELLDRREYTNDGICIDGLRSHRLVFVNDVQLSHNVEKTTPQSSETVEVSIKSSRKK